MSGLYNLVLGDGREAQRGMLCCILLDLGDLADFGRFRDAWFEWMDDNLRMVIYTRNGGGNRPDYADITDALRDHALFLEDADDEFDSTYASYYFRLPMEQPPQHLVDQNVKWAEEWPKLVKQLERIAVEPVDMNQRWQQAIEKLETEGPTPEQAAAFAPVGEALKQTLDGAEPRIVTVGRDPKRAFEDGE